MVGLESPTHRNEDPVAVLRMDELFPFLPGRGETPGVAVEEDDVSGLDVPLVDEVARNLRSDAEALFRLPKGPLRVSALGHVPRQDGREPATVSRQAPDRHLQRDFPTAGMDSDLLPDRTVRGRSVLGGGGEREDARDQSFDRPPDDRRDGLPEDTFGGPVGEDDSPVTVGRQDRVGGDFRQRAEPGLALD